MKTRRPTGAAAVILLAQVLAGGPASAAATHPSVRPTQHEASLGPLSEIPQTLNNCGPASVAEVLAYWHIYRSQAAVAAVLRADNNPRGMSFLGLPQYARSLGLRSLIGFSGSQRLVKALIANGFPVIVSQYVSASDRIRHYRPIEAFDDRAQTFTSADPYLGAGHVISYAEFNTIWSESDYRFQILYPPALQTRLSTVLAFAGWNAVRTYTQALGWQQRRMADRRLRAPGTWLWANGYADLAWIEAELGRFAAADRDVERGSQRGLSPIIAAWVRQEIDLLKQHR